MICAHVSVSSSDAINEFKIVGDYLWRQVTSPTGPSKSHCMLNFQAISAFASPQVCITSSVEAFTTPLLIAHMMF